MKGIGILSRTLEYIIKLLKGASQLSIPVKPISLLQFSYEHVRNSFDHHVQRPQQHFVRFVTRVPQARTCHVPCVLT